MERDWYEKKQRRNYSWREKDMIQTRECGVEADEIVCVKVNCYLLTEI